MLIKGSRRCKTNMTGGSSRCQAKEDIREMRRKIREENEREI